MADTLSKARDNHERQQDVRKQYADSKRRDLSFQVKDLVLVNTHVLSKAKAGITTKFAPRRDGPYQISRIVSSTSYEIIRPDNPSMPLGTYDVSALTKYVAPASDAPPEPVHPIRRRGRPRKEESSTIADIRSPRPSSPKDSTKPSSRPTSPMAMASPCAREVPPGDHRDLASVEEVHDILNSIRSEAYGVDNISSSMLKYCSPLIDPYVTHIINCCIERKYFPCIWKQAVGLPLAKISNPESFSDLRVISI
ncbi:hypothetical protein NQ315_016750 [Exocentrus adspersus]|uniref:Reverse transcriptase domain-containing protein n=1 Tax=Exocentrus adspersus TaxID=1586481 RepID=A0AAV8VCM6_9CUCU|nr:hypothetical protein NQ315_016750 [Exocentrus adspersus]